MMAGKKLSGASRRIGTFFRRLLWGMGWLWTLLGLAIILGIVGLVFQRNSNPKSEFPSQAISVTVYVGVSPARVSLNLYAYLQPQYDTLHINVTGPNAQSDPWILVVQCPNGTKPASQLPVYTEGTSGIQPVEDEIVSNHDHKNYSQSLGCYSVPKLPAATVTGQDIDVSLPVLEQNQAAQSAQAATPLYVERSKIGKKKIEALVEVLQPPDSSCQTTGPSPSQAPSLSLLGVSGSRVTSPLHDFYSLPSAITTPCFTPLYSDSTATQYHFPTSVATSETLENVSLANDSVNSMFPPGQITSSDKVEWQGTPDATLSPSLSATSLSSAQSAGTDIFIAGLLIGAAAGFFAPFVQGIPEPWRKALTAAGYRRKKKDRLQVEMLHDRDIGKWSYRVPALDISGDAATLEAALQRYCADMARALEGDQSGQPPVAAAGPDGARAGGERATPGAGGAQAAPVIDGAEAGPAGPV
jgi:hypothetical protein